MVGRGVFIVMESLFVVDNPCMSVSDVGISAWEKVEDNLLHLFIMLVCKKSSTSAKASSCFFKPRMNKVIFICILIFGSSNSL